MAVAGTVNPEFENATYAKVSRRLIPFLFLCYIVAFLDRVNVGFAKLQMAGDLQFSDAVYGVGAGIFFIGYFIFEVPSNVILRAGRRAHLDRPHHDHLGDHFLGVHVHGSDSVGSDRTAVRLDRRGVQLLLPALPAGCGRGRLLPRHHPVPDLLVSVRDSARARWPCS